MRCSTIARLCFFCLVAAQVGCQPPVVDVSSDIEPRSQANAAEQSEANVEVLIADLAKLEELIHGQAGKVVVVDIWSTSCAPCLREFPHLVELSMRYPESVACISFNVDYIGLKSKPPQSYLPPVEDFLQKQRAKLTNLLSSATDETVLAKFKLESIPAILIFGPEGKLLYTLTDVNTGEDGLTYVGDVIPRIEELLLSQK